MKPTEPLPLNHSWPLIERARKFELGCVMDWPTDPSGIDRQALTARGVGLWDCDLSDETLTWTDEVYDLFGLPRGCAVRRDEAVALYCEHSRAVMERLRNHAIRHRRGFTLDVEIRPSLTGRRWMRITAAPVCDGGRVLRLAGLKQPL